MDVIQTVKELFEPTFEAIGDSDLSYEQKRALLFDMYCFACAVYPGYVAHPLRTLFEYGCCFIIEPERHPDYDGSEQYKYATGKTDAVPGGGRWYVRDGKPFVKYDYGSELFKRLVLLDVIPPQDRTPIPMVSLYASVYLCCNMFDKLRPLWYTYYFYLDATNEPVDEEFNEKLFELLHNTRVYDAAMEVRGSMLIGDEAELGAGNLLDWYKPFIERRRTRIFDVFEKHINAGDPDFVAEYSTELIKRYPESVALMNWNAASRTECVARDKDAAALEELVRDLKEYAECCDSQVVKKYLKLAVLMKKNVDGEG